MESKEVKEIAAKEISSSRADHAHLLDGIFYCSPKSQVSEAQAQNNNQVDKSKDNSPGKDKAVEGQTKETDKNKDKDKSDKPKSKEVIEAEIAATKKLLIADSTKGPWNEKDKKAWQDLFKDLNASEEFHPFFTLRRLVIEINRELAKNDPKNGINVFSQTIKDKIAVYTSLGLDGRDPKPEEELIQTGQETANLIKVGEMKNPVSILSSAAEKGEWSDDSRKYWKVLFKEFASTKGVTENSILQELNAHGAQVNDILEEKGIKSRVEVGFMLIDGKSTYFIRLKLEGKDNDKDLDTMAQGKESKTLIKIGEFVPKDNKESKPKPDSDA